MGEESGRGIWEKQSVEASALRDDLDKAHLLMKRHRRTGHFGALGVWRSRFYLLLSPTGAYFDLPTCLCCALYWQGTRMVSNTQAHLPNFRRRRNVTLTFPHSGGHGVPSGLKHLMVTSSGIVEALASRAAAKEVETFWLRWMHQKNMTAKRSRVFMP